MGWFKFLIEDYRGYSAVAATRLVRYRRCALLVGYDTPSIGSRHCVPGSAVLYLHLAFSLGLILQSVIIS